MLRSTFSPIHVDGQHLAFAQEVADRGQEQGAATLISPCFDNQLRPHLIEDLLVAPEVKRALEHPMAQPERVSPRLLAALVVQPVELVNE